MTEIQRLLNLYAYYLHQIIFFDRNIILTNTVSHLFFGLQQMLNQRCLYACFVERNFNSLAMTSLFQSAIV